MTIPNFLRKREIRRLKKLARDDYAAYLKSAWWRKRRARALRRAKHRCEITRLHGQLHVHHCTYENIGCERDDDLIAVLSALHRHIHATGKGRWTRRQLLDDQKLRREWGGRNWLVGALR